MADTNVVITHVNEDALDNLPPWATEATASQIAGLLQKSYDVQKQNLDFILKHAAAAAGGGAGLSKESIAEAQDEFDKMVKGLKEDEKEQPKKKKRWKEEEDEHKKRKKHWTEAKTYGEAFNIALAAAGKYVQKTFEENFDTYKKLNEAGINLVAGFDHISDGFNGVQQLAQLTGVRFTQLAATMTKYNTAVNAFSAGKFAKTVGQATKGLAEFGFSSKEGADLLGSMLETQMGYTNIQEKSVQETSIDLQRFGERIMRLSAATGMARTAILQNLEALSKSNEASVLQGQAGEQAAESTLEFVSSLKNQHFGQALLKLMTDSIKPLNQTFQSFQKIGQGGFAQKIAAFSQSIKGLSPEEAARATKAFADSNRAEIEHNKQLANLYSQVPELAGEANEALTIYNGLQQSARAIKPLTDKQAADLKKTNKARADLDTQWEALMSRLQAAFAPSVPLIELLAKGLGLLVKGIDWVSGWFSDTEKTWIGVGTILVGLLSSLKVFASGLKFFTGKTLGIFENFSNFGLRFLGWIGIAVAEFKLIYWAVSGLVSFFSEKFPAFGNLMANVFDTIFGAFESVPGEFGDTISKMWDDMTTAFSNALDDPIQFIKDSINLVGDSIHWWVDHIGDALKSLWETISHPFSSVGKLLGGDSTDAKKVATAIAPPSPTATGVNTISKDPAPSTINSPSATQPTAGTDVAPNVKDTITGYSTLDKGSKDSPNTDIGGHLAIQTDLLSKIADHLGTMSSTNKDILKYTKAQQ